MIYDLLYPHQKNIVNSITKNSYGLFLDMGIGKTPISLALAEKNKCTKILVIAPNNTVIESPDTEGSWIGWNEHSEITYNYNIKHQTSFSELQNDFYLINYESLHNRKKNRKMNVMPSDDVEAFIKSCKGHNIALIIDEAHALKDLKSIQSKVCNKIRNELKRVSKELHCYLLTGTPFTKGYEDMYPLLKFLGYDHTKEIFIDNYCVRGNVPGLLGWQQPIVGYKNTDKMFEMVHQYAMTIESSAVQNLPEQIFVNHKLPITKEFVLLSSEILPGKTIFKEIKVREGLELAQYNVNRKVNNPYYRDIDYTTDKKIGRWIADTTGGFWMRCRQIGIGFNGNAEECVWYNTQRLDELKSFLKDNEDNYVLFYNYTPELLALYDVCEELDYSIDVYCGEIKSLTFYEKYAKQSEFEQLSNKKNIILANFASGSEGKNWQKYNKCIIFSLPVYKDWAQGLKRVHRTGQTKTVFYHVFYQDNWLDNGMYKALKEQVNYSKDMFESDLERVKQLIKN